MNSSIDISAAAILIGILPTRIPVFTAASGEIQPTDDTFAIAASSDLQHVADGLHTCTLNLLLNTPALPGDPDLLAEHKRMADSIFAIIREPANLAARWQSDDIGLCGSFLTATATATEDNRWQTRFTIKLGIQPLI